MISVISNINKYAKVIGLSTLATLSSCSQRKINTVHDLGKTVIEIKSPSANTQRLISMLEGGDAHSIKIIGVPKDTKMLTFKEIKKYVKDDTKGEIFYQVYAGKADKAIRKANNKKGTLVTVGDGIARKGHITLANGQKAHEGDFISKAMADSLYNDAISINDSLLKSKIAVNTYSKLKNYEHDAVLSYLYNAGPKPLSKTTNGKSFFQYLSEDNKGMVQAKFSIEASAQCAKAGLAKRNLINMIVYGDGKIYKHKKAQKNFKRQIEIISRNKHSDSILQEVINMSRAYGVNPEHLKETEEKINKLIK